MRHHHVMRHACLSLAIAALGAFARPAAALDVYYLDSGLTPAQVESQPYSYYVKNCVDTLIQYGTDRYGAVSTPLLMSVIDVRDLTAPSAQDVMALDEIYRAERRGRRNPGGSNLWMDQETLGVMYDLAQKTGQSAYAAFADNYINYYTTNVVKTNGLINWGWHEYYDAYSDVKTSYAGDYHEIHYQQARWPMLAAVNSAAVASEANGLWQYHVVDKNTGEINRHDDNEHGCSFAFTGGPIVSSFAYQYQQTGEQQWLDRAKLVANYYWNQRNTATNLIATTPTQIDRFDGNRFDTTVSGLYASCLLDAYQSTSDPLFRDQATAYLKAYANYGFDVATGKWWGSLNLDGTHVAGPNTITDPDNYDAYEARGSIDLWQPDAGLYSRPLETALTYAEAAKLTGDPDLLQAAERWADFIRQSLPAGPCDPGLVTWYAEYARDWGTYGAYAEQYGKTIDFFADMAELTDNPEYVALARSIADDAVSKLYYNGLFRGHPCTPYYESFDGVGDLLGALSRLDAVHAPEPGSFVLLTLSLLSVIPYGYWKGRRRTPWRNGS